MLKQFFTSNLDVVFMVYGLSFVIMAVSILIQPRKESVFRLSDILWILAGFGLTHGLNEWLDMFSIIVLKRGGQDSDLFNFVRLTILAVSFVFLFEFGRRLLLLKLKKYLTGWLTLSLCFFAFTFMLVSSQERSIWPRYFLGFPGALFSAVGFIYYYRDNKTLLKPFKVRRFFLLAGVSLAVYSLLGGLVVPKANLFPASILNNTSFLKLIGVPVQVFRAICAAFLAWAVWNILGIFNWEIMYKLKSSQMQINAVKTYIDNIIRSIGDCLIVVNPKAKIMAVNKATCQLLGYEEKELIAKPVQELLQEEPPFTGAKLKALAKDDYFKNYELTCVSKMKLKIPVLFSASVMRGEEGEIIATVAVGKDMRELKNLRERLTHSEKLAAIGEISGIIGHEFRNQLGVMINSVYFLKMKLQDADEKIKRHLEILEEEITDTNKIIETISTFAKTKQLQLKTLDLKELLLASIKKAEIPKKISVVTHLDKVLPKIKADEIQLTRVFINIILNAVEAMAGEGRLTVKALRWTDYLSILFEDTGPGIKEEDKKVIFEPFFSTKAPGRGLGLTACSVILEAHGGSINIESEAGKGATVIVRLPIIKEKNE